MLISEARKTHRVLNYRVSDSFLVKNSTSAGDPIY